MKIVSISDSHNNHRELEIPDADVFIHCGDITMCGEVDVLEDFNKWLGELPHSYKIVIAGNHDKNKFLSKLITNAIYLEGQSVEIDDKLFYGEPITTWEFPSMASYFAFGKLRNSQMRKIWEKVPENTDILITHAPPLGILDKNIYGEKCGDKYLLERVNKIKPKYNIFGHIHENYGIKETKHTTFINCSVLNELYNCRNKPVEFHL